jgi:SAM-dependent methyltransferase
MTSTDTGRQSTAGHHEAGTPAVGAIDFGDFRRTTPIAGQFGYERGQPIDRHYIEGFLQENAPVICGHVLEIGDNTYTTRFGGEHVRRSEVLHVTSDSPSATIVADLADAPEIPPDTFDCVICTQTLQLIYDVRAAVATLHRIVRPGGVVLATFPGISQVDDPAWAPSWYWHFTPASARRLFGDVFGNPHVQVESHGNVLTAMCFLHGLASHELRRGELDIADPRFPFLITVRAIKA